MIDVNRLEREFANAILNLLDHPNARGVIQAGLDTFKQAEFRRVMGWPIDRFQLTSCNIPMHGGEKYSRPVEIR